ncbi:hypothetical protein Glove_16g70 [Diversispora epigaea]|uniref:C2H2-type domain-containing protein n=1 Tax=Diversispora epigaea TaxID=1348612 RepID=A0A397JPI3_9GLOM|nr:hypothetical protein Glove_16g70 [Diversispora epigaea]
MPSTLLNATCFTCGKTFKNYKGLAQHKQYIQRYNQYQELDELPDNTIVEFKQICHIHYYSNTKRLYKCIFRGHDTYQILSTIFNSNQWGKKIYSQNQQTYVVCLDFFFQNTLIIEEIDPLVKLLQ